MDPRRRLVGRSAEQAHLLRMLDGAVAGQPGVTLIHGEPGIGKTTLVRELADAARARRFHVLFAQCLRFGSEVTANVPITRALDRWARATDHETVGQVFPGMASNPDFLHPPGQDGGGSQGVLFRLAGAVERLAEDAPTVLVVDDLQWADPSSLDVLSFIVAGLQAGQHLALGLTYRDSELGEGHRLHGWLADVRRIRGVSHLPLGRLSAEETEQLVLGLPDRQTDVALADRVFARSEGNPYLAELVAQEVGGAADSWSPLSEALLASWHRLGPDARAVTQLVAVAGRAVAVLVLRDLVARRGLEVDVTAAVREAVDEGVLIRQDTTDVWFRHPLLAEVILETLPPWQLPEVHRAYAASWKAAQSVTDAERATHLALHYAAAQDAEPALRWALRAADESLRLHAIAEGATHLTNAVDLLAAVPEGTGPPAGELLTRAARCLLAAGRPARALEFYERALSDLDQQKEPLAACRILMALNFAKAVNTTGSSSASIADFERAVALTDPFPDSRERALALAHRAYFEVFEGIEAAAEDAEQAVRLAEGIGADDALAWALVVRAQTRWGTRDGVADAERAWALARAVDETELLIRVSINVCNSYDSVGRLAASASLAREVHALMRQRGSAQGISCMGARAALTLVQLGEWDSARSVTRETLALRLNTRWGAAARCGAAVLNALEGNTVMAEAHLARARELMPVSDLGDDVVLSEMIVAIEAGHPRRTLELVEAWMARAVAIDHRSADELLQVAARAAADLAEGGSGGSEEAKLAAVSSLERIGSLRGDSPPLWWPSGRDDAVQPARGALFAADLARCHGEARRAAPLWEAAARATDRAGLRFEYARSQYHLGRSLLGEPKGREKAAEALGRAVAVADHLGAVPLAAAVRQLALQAHLSLGGTQVAGSAAAGSLRVVAGAALTPRETEVLDHLLAGETYAQMARHLYISEKTVSTHVSNLLRKTGTTSRIELAALAVRDRTHPD